MAEDRLEGIPDRSAERRQRIEDMRFEGADPGLDDLIGEQPATDPVPRSLNDTMRDRQCGARTGWDRCPHMADLYLAWGGTTQSRWRVPVCASCASTWLPVLTENYTVTVTRV